MQTTIPTIELFAGIAGFSSLHTQPVALVEKDASCRAVLRRHHPHALILEDVRSVGAHNLPWAPVQKFGFPCQDLSVAGNRAGLKGARSGLFYEATRIADELRPDYLIWENVPGLLSSGSGRDFLAVLTELDRIGFAGGWTTVDAQFFGVAQRRCRVFGVFARRDIGAARCAEILSLAARLPWNLTPSYKKRTNVAARAGSGAEGNSGNVIPFQQNQRNEVRDLGSVVGSLPAQPGMKQQNYIAHTLTANYGKQIDSSDTNNGPPNLILTAPAIALSNRGRDTGDVFETLRAGSHGALPMVCGGERVRYALTAHHGRNSGEDEFIVAGTLGAEHGRNRGLGQENEVDMLVCGAQSAAHGGPDDNSAQAGHIIAFTERGREGGRNVEWQNDLAYTQTNPGKGGRAQERTIAGNFGVRRLTPTECERLQGFPDDYTAWGIDEQGGRVEMSDSQRYRMLGNAICKKVSAWIDSQLVRYL